MVNLSMATLLTTWRHWPSGSWKMTNCFRLFPSLPFFSWRLPLRPAVKNQRRETVPLEISNCWPCWSETAPASPMFLNPWYGQVGAGPAPEDAAATASQKITADEPTEPKSEPKTELCDDSSSAPSSVATATAATVAAGSEATKTYGDHPSIDSKSTLSSSSASSTSASTGDPTVAIQKRLKCGWTAHVTQDGRLFYCK